MCCHTSTCCWPNGPQSAAWCFWAMRATIGARGRFRRARRSSSTRTGRSAAAPKACAWTYCWATTISATFAGGADRAPSPHSCATSARCLKTDCTRSLPAPLGRTCARTPASPAHGRSATCVTRVNRTRAPLPSALTPCWPIQTAGARSTAARPRAADGSCPARCGPTCATLPTTRCPASANWSDTRPSKPPRPHGFGRQTARTPTFGHATPCRSPAPARP